MEINKRIFKLKSKFLFPLKLRNPYTVFQKQIALYNNYLISKFNPSTYKTLLEKVP
ncbi:hypothetical protein UT300006_21330 [Clostridium sp. CTA-6]